jgi:hypothetical protein
MNSLSEVKEMYSKLKFRRQFLLTAGPMVMFDNWNCLKLEQHFLYTHPDLDVVAVGGLDKRIVLVGCIFDYSQPEKENAEILEDIHKSVQNVNELFVRIKQYAGRYVLLYKDYASTIILQDALALREVYYCVKDNRIVCGSQPNLIAEYGNPRIEERNDTEFLEYYQKNSTNKRWSPYRKWIGDETYYEGVKHLLPNHFLDINKRGASRYWPNEPIKRLDLDEAVSRGCSFLQGSMRAIVNRYPVMMAVTAGTDSRTLLAASRGMQNKIYYFVNDEGLGRSNPDISIPNKIFKSINVPFHVHGVQQYVDDRFRQIFLSNTFFASDRILPTIYNVYFKKHSEKVNILGIGEIGRARYGKEPKNLNKFRMLYKIVGHSVSRYELKQAEKILSELLPVGRLYGLNVLTLLYWEHALGNWGVTGNSESDIAIEELNPFDSHLLYETLLGVDERQSRIKNSKLFKEMIRNMWPELLEWPINPPHTRQHKMKTFLYKIGLFEILKELKYQINYGRYRYKTWKLRQ